VALADMAVTRRLNLVEMARHIVTGEVDPASSTRTRKEIVTSLSIDAASGGQSA
jgi:hypothetical protein